MPNGTGGRSLSAAQDQTFDSNEDMLLLDLIQVKEFLSKRNLNKIRTPSWPFTVHACPI